MVEISAVSRPLKTNIKLSGSKSISNRALILNEVKGISLTLSNLSDSEDTLLLQQALKQINTLSSGSIDVHHAGSDLRFLTAYLSLTKGSWILTGSERIQQRPIAGLVEALKNMGADITYTDKENCPPLKIIGTQLKGAKVEIDAGSSSQFVSALLLIAPMLDDDIEFSLTGTIVSRSYIDLTIGMLREIGYSVIWEHNTIQFKKETNLHLNTDYTVESDWSSASYWYSICALSPGAQVTLGVLHQNSWQPDSVLAEIYYQLGVETEFCEGRVSLKHIGAKVSNLDYDFSNCPDIAQTVAVTCFGLGIKATLRGLKTLRWKETDRIFALDKELTKCGAVLKVEGDVLILEKTQKGEGTLRKPDVIVTYGDHRMAMSFAPLALIFGSITIQDPDVVLKSYPLFWQDLQSAGFGVTLRP
jgi:3-phosphoshikimate 1-carboxyvinyltransferase